MPVSALDVHKLVKLDVIHHVNDLFNAYNRKEEERKEERKNFAMLHTESAC